MLCVAIVSIMRKEKGRRCEKVGKERRGEEKRMERREGVQWKWEKGK